MVEKEQRQTRMSWLQRRAKLLLLLSVACAGVAPAGAPRRRIQVPYGTCHGGARLSSACAERMYDSLCTPPTTSDVEPHKL
jgi:hypothetical protein